MIIITDCTHPGGFEYYQVAVGDVPVPEADPSSRQSFNIRDLYLVGETLDVVGPSSGYNLHNALAGQQLLIYPFDPMGF